MTLRTTSSFHSQMMMETIFTIKKRRVKTEATGFRIREIVNYTAEGVRSDSKHYCYGKTEYEEYGWEIGRYYHTGAGEPTLDPTIQTYMNYQSTDLPMSVLNMVLGLDPNGQYRSFKSNPFMSYSPSGGYPVYTWEWECTFSIQLPAAPERPSRSGLSRSYSLLFKGWCNPI